MTYTFDSSAQDTWREATTSVTPEYLFLHAPEVVWKARVNMLITPVYPLYFFLWDTETVGSYTDLEEDMTLLIGSTDGADDLGRVRLRKNLLGSVATSDKLYIQRSSQGILDGEIDCQDNAYLTVLRFFPIWSIPPLIDPNNIIYKDAEVPFDADANQFPVANTGIDQLHVVENIGDSVDIPCGEWASYATAPGETIDTYAWTAPDGQTSSSATPTFTIEADTVGYVTLTVTDTAGNSTTSRRFWAVVNKNHANLFQNFELPSLTAGINGQTTSVIIHDDIPVSTYPNGTECLVAMRENYGGTVGTLVGSPGAEQMLISGWIGAEEMNGEWSERGYLHKTSLQLLDSAGRMRLLPGFTQLMERESSPTHWGQMAGANLDRYVVHLGYWHSNLFRRIDFMWSGTGDTYGFRVLGSDSGSLFDQLGLRTRAIRHELTCDRYGRLQMLPDPQLQAEADRTADLIISIREADWQSLRRSFNFHPRHHWQFGEKVVASTEDASSAGGDITTVFTIAPGLAPGMGLAAFTAGEELVTSQQEANQVDGARYRARTNAREGTYEITLTRMGYAVDPALLKWVRFEVTSETAGVRGRTVASTTRFLPIEIQHTYDARNGSRVQRWTLEREGTQVIDAVTDTRVGNPGFDAPTLPIYPQPTPLPQPIYDLRFPPQGYARIAVLVAIAAGNAKLVPTTTFDQSSPTWTQNTLSLDGAEVMHDGVPNPAEPTQWECATSTKLRVYQNAIASPSVLYSNAFSYAVQTGTRRSIQHERNVGNENWIASAFYALSRGLVYQGSIDGGATLQSPVDIGDTLTYAFAAAQGTFAKNYAPLWLDPHTAGRALTVARSGGTIYKLFETLDFGATWHVYTGFQTPYDASTFVQTVGYIEQSFQDPASLYFGAHDFAASAQSQLNFKATASTITPRLSGTFMQEWVYAPATGGYAGQVGRRMFRPCDNNPNKFLLFSAVDSGFSAANTHGIGKVLNGLNIIDLVPFADYPTTNWWLGGHIGGDSLAVYAWGQTHSGGTNGVPIGYIDNIDTAAGVADLVMKKGTGFPTSGEALNLGGF